jgi:hypothetical protein
MYLIEIVWEVWTEFILASTGHVISRLSEPLLERQEGFCSMQLVNWLTPHNS